MPFKSDVHLTVKVHLRQKHDMKYYIQSQEDLYQLNDLIKFFVPGGAELIWLVQLLATFICTIGTMLLAPLMNALQRRTGLGKTE
jgi:hypothetical protein